MKRKTRVTLLVTVIIILAAAAAVAIFVSKSQNKLESLSTLKIENVDLSKISDGVYSGSYSAFPISVKVRVTVANHKITGIELVKHSNGQGSQAEKVTDLVIEAQSLEVDSISGATYSSKVILKSIENALKSK